MPKGCSLVGQVKVTFTPILRTGALFDLSGLHKLAQDAGETLFGDLQDGQQALNGDAWVAAHKVEDAVVCPAETVAFQNGVRVSDKIPVSEEQKLHGLNKARIGQ